MHAILAVTQEAEAPGVIHSKIVSRNTSKPGWGDSSAGREQETEGAVPDTEKTKT